MISKVTTRWHVVQGHAKVSQIQQGVPKSREFPIQHGLHFALPNCNKIIKLNVNKQQNLYQITLRSVKVFLIERSFISIRAILKRDKTKTLANCLAVYKTLAHYIRMLLFELSEN